MLSYSVVLCTFRRPQVAVQCVRYMLAQSRPPAEVVVVAAESDPTTTRDMFLSALPSLASHVLFQFVRAPQGLTLQRNAGTACATGDIVLFLDDDCFAPPGFARPLLSLFEADHEGVVGGAQGSVVEGRAAREWVQGHDTVNSSHHTERAVSSRGTLRAEVRRRLWTVLFRYIGPRYPESVFRPIHLLPPNLESPTRQSVCWLSGGCMAWRRQVLDQFKFNELFHEYAAAEDVDYGFRASRRYCLVKCLDAPIYHMQYDGGRPAGSSLTYQLLLNLSLIGRANMEQTQALHRHILRHHFRFGVSFDIVRLLGGHSPQHLRAALAAMAVSREMFAAPDAAFPGVFMRARKAWGTGVSMAVPSLARH